MLIGCDDALDPFTDLPNNLVIYSILDNRNDVSFVRMHKIYYEKNNKHFEDSIKVKLFENYGLSYDLKDTVMGGFENYRMYKIPREILKRGSYYRLSIYKGDSLRYYADCLYQPDSRLTIKDRVTNEIYYTDLLFSIHAADIFLFRLSLRYTVNNGTEEIEQLLEIPIDIAISKDNPFFEEKKPIWSYLPNQVDNIKYPAIQIKTDISLNGILHNGYNYYKAYHEDNIAFVMNYIRVKESGKTVKIKGMTGSFYSIDYDYYLQHYKDETMKNYSIRADAPYYWTNIQSVNSKGYGYFGSITKDSVKFKLSNYMIARFGFINDQD
jgi:hypothetical protein